MKFYIGFRGCNPIWVGGGEGGFKFHFHSTKLHKIEEIPIAHMQEEGKEEGRGGGRETERKGRGRRKVKEKGSRKRSCEIIRRWLNPPSSPHKIPLNCQTCRNPKDHTP